MKLPEKLSLAQLPTPLQRMDRLSEAWGGPTIWVKRDDLTGFEVSGNKIRKLEFHLAAARAIGADTLITCGAIQSNHARATSLAAPPLGLEVIVLLRTPDGGPPERSEANHLLMEIAGADLRYVTPEQYAVNESLMAEVAEEVHAAGRTPWIIAEGASDAVGMWGYAAAMEEFVTQTRDLPQMTAIWHASMSGGTTAGMAWGADQLGMETQVVGCGIGESAEASGERIRRIWEAAAADSGETPPDALPLLIDDHVGLGYGKATHEELVIQGEVTRLTGMLMDPTYTGKALVGLKREIEAGRFGPDDHVVFWHTGGGFATFVEGFQFAR